MESSTPVECHHFQILKNLDSLSWEICRKWMFFRTKLSQRLLLLPCSCCCQDSNCCSHVFWVFKGPGHAFRTTCGTYCTHISIWLHYIPYRTQTSEHSTTASETISKDLLWALPWLRIRCWVVVFFFFSMQSSGLFIWNINMDLKHQHLSLAKTWNQNCPEREA